MLARVKRPKGKLSPLKDGTGHSPHVKLNRGADSKDKVCKESTGLAARLFDTIWKLAVLECQRHCTDLAGPCARSLTAPCPCFPIALLSDPLVVIPFPHHWYVPAFPQAEVTSQHRNSWDDDMVDQDNSRYAVACGQFFTWRTHAVPTNSARLSPCRAHAGFNMSLTKEVPNCPDATCPCWALSKPSSLSAWLDKWEHGLWRKLVWPAGGFVRIGSHV